MQMEYLAFKNTDTSLNFKDFLLDIFHLIIKYTQEIRIKVVHFGDKFLLVLDSESSFSKALQSIKTIQKKKFKQVHQTIKNLGLLIVMFLWQYTTDL